MDLGEGVEFNVDYSVQSTILQYREPMVFLRKFTNPLTGVRIWPKLLDKLYEWTATKY